jgi:hypothetical protein
MYREFRLEAHQAWAKKWREKHADKLRIQSKARHAKRMEQLPDDLIKKYLHLEGQEVPPELIKLRRALVLLNRAIREKLQCETPKL